MRLPILRGKVPFFYRLGSIYLGSVSLFFYFIYFGLNTYKSTKVFLFIIILLGSLHRDCNLVTHTHTQTHTQTRTYTYARTHYTRTLILHISHLALYAPQIHLYSLTPLTTRTFLHTLTPLHSHTHGELFFL